MRKIEKIVNLIQKFDDGTCSTRDIAMHLAKHNPELLLNIVDELENPQKQPFNDAEFRSKLMFMTTNDAINLYMKEKKVTMAAAKSAVEEIARKFNNGEDLC